MIKEKTTGKEIAATILAYCVASNLDIRRVTVWPSEANGWNASFLADLTSISPLSLSETLYLANQRESGDARGR
jgi:hypothetical protein